MKLLPGILYEMSDSLQAQNEELIKVIVYLRSCLKERAPLADSYDSLLAQYKGLLVKNVILQDQIDDLERYITWTGDTRHPMRKRKMV